LSTPEPFRDELCPQRRATLRQWLTSQSLRKEDGFDLRGSSALGGKSAVETKESRSVGGSSVTLYASVNRGGGGAGRSAQARIRHEHLLWIQRAPLGVAGVRVEPGGGFAESTEYHFRISATNAADTGRGEDVTFKTSDLKGVALWFGWWEAS
jgi:hypothetical protein